MTKSKVTRILQTKVIENLLCYKVDLFSIAKVVQGMARSAIFGMKIMIFDFKIMFIDFAHVFLVFVNICIISCYLLKESRDWYQLCNRYAEDVPLIV